MKFEILDPLSSAGLVKKEEIVDFLYNHLDQYGDTKEDIMKCLNYALRETSMDGGLILLGYEGNELVGAVVINKTGMKGYIPENILVYIAVHRDHRGKGYGKVLMKKILELTEGDVKLHVEHDNPARFLYEKVGFTNKYLEYRYKRSEEA